MKVLNLVINGLPSILRVDELEHYSTQVLNLVINGLPSIQKEKVLEALGRFEF